MVKIRLARVGRAKRPLYTIVAADSRMPRDGRFLEKLGQYRPNDSKQVLWDVKTDSIKSWLGKGAVLSETLTSLFKKNGIDLSS
ncbi:MAG: 30S ribosomal protein S16 [Bacteriovoracales bacterium]|nr:30S ribosomal protein S16 [Bacteriovoracales bacterium]